MNKNYNFKVGNKVLLEYDGTTYESDVCSLNDRGLYVYVRLGINDPYTIPIYQYGKWNVEIIEKYNIRLMPANTPEKPEEPAFTHMRYDGWNGADVCALNPDELRQPFLPYNTDVYVYNSNKESFEPLALDSIIIIRPDKRMGFCPGHEFDIFLNIYNFVNK